MEKAHVLAREAMEAVDKLGQKHPRRQARANIWFGRVLLRKPFMDLERASECWRRAKDLFPSPQAEADYIGEELKALEKEINEAKAEVSSGRPSNAVIVTVKYADVLDSPWKETKRWLADTIISALVISRTDDQIKDSISIRAGELDEIKKRCKASGLISEERLHERRGRKKKDSLLPPPAEPSLPGKA